MNRKKSEQRIYDTNLLLIEYLHGKVLFGRLVLNEHDSTEGSSAQRFDPIEIVQARRILQCHNRVQHV